MQLDSLLRTPKEDVQPWFRQFWLWFLITLPGVVVIASFITLYIAVSGRDSLVKDDYYKDGLAINVDIDRDKIAVARNLEAALTIDANNNVALTLRGDLAQKEIKEPEQLLVQFIHPMRDAQDLRIAMPRIDANHYRAQLPRHLEGHWYVEINDPIDNTWRLRQEINLNAAQPLIVKP
jgi:hypothetical protein